LFLFTLDKYRVSSAYRLLQNKPIRSNLFDYEIINNELCGKIDVEIDLLIVIISKSGSHERRKAIRRTYGNFNNTFKYIHDTSSRLEVRFLFMIDVDETRLKAIQYEQQIFKDIVQVKNLHLFYS
jgi:hypothetical protein